MSNEMTVVEAYIKFNKQLVILISGLSGCHKNKVAKKIAELFKIKHINLRDFLKEDYDKKVELSNGVKVTDWDNIEAYNWVNFNAKVEELKTEGIIVSGTAFPSNKLDFTVDNHINIKISKRKYISSRHKFLTENQDTNRELFELIDTPTELLIINKIIYPNYLEYVKESTINKFINGNDIDSTEIFNMTFDYLIAFIQNYLNRRNRTKASNRLSPSTQPIQNKQEQTTQKHTTEDDSSEQNNSDDDGYSLGVVNPRDKYIP
jgi:hypothetical protein